MGQAAVKTDIWFMRMQIITNNNYYFWLLFNQSIFCRSLQVMLNPPQKNFLLWGLLVLDSLQAKCPSQHPTNSGKALKSLLSLSVLTAIFQVNLAVSWFY